MHTIPGNAQHIGARREQQDDFGFSDLDDCNFISHGGVLAIVADGMGGLAMGRDASRLAKQTMLEEYEAKTPEESIPDALRRALEAANTAVCELSRQAGQEGEVGTTLVAAVIKDHDLHWVSVGDSRIYFYRQGELYQLTTDHDYARELARMAEAGQITWEEAAGDPNRRALTSYLGLPHLIEVDQSSQPVPLKADDRILLCSDGLYGSLTIAEMAEFLETNAQESAELLIEAALTKQKTSQDNLTVAILACERERFCHRLKYLPVLRDFHNWRQNWSMLITAAIIGALCAGSGIWAATRYWPAAAPIVQEVNQSLGQRKMAESIPPKLTEPAKPAGATISPGISGQPLGANTLPSQAVSPATPPMMENKGQGAAVPAKPRTTPPKVAKQQRDQSNNQNKNISKDKNKEQDKRRKISE
jgi:PPM family protein phosphatase